MMSRQKLGQHFLLDAGWRARIAATLEGASAAGDAGLWVEIGAGHGEMTQHLIRAGRRIIAIEIDPGLADALRARARDWPGVEVSRADVLALDLAQLTGGRFCVCGNLPYHITAPILHHLFRFADQIAAIHIVIQREVAARIVAQPGRRAFGYLSALCQFYTQPEVLLRIPPGAFCPRPRVASALVRMTLPGERARLGLRDEPAFLKFVQKCFRQKRKTLRNNLRTFLPAGRAAAALAACGLGHDTRAEQLTLRQLADLFTQVAPGQLSD